MKQVFQKFFTTLGIIMFITFLFPRNINAAAAINPVVLPNTYSSTAKLPQTTITVPVNTHNITNAVNVSGKGLVTFEITGQRITCPVTVQLYSDAAYTRTVDFSVSLYYSGASNKLETYVPAKGTYYLQISQNDSTQNCQVRVKAYSYSSEDRLLKNNTWAGSYCDNYDTTIYHKIKIPKSGYIQITGYSANGFHKGAINDVYLCNSRKKPLSDNIWLSSIFNNTSYQGVKKGTYYIAVKGNNLYDIKYNFTAVKDKNISSKRKAATLKRNRTAKGLMLAGESGRKTDWYKIKLTKTRRVKLSLRGYVDGAFDLQITNSKGRTVSSTYYIFKGKASTKTHSRRLTKGTYYVKISKRLKSKTASGGYTLKWR